MIKVAHQNAIYPSTLAHTGRQYSANDESSSGSGEQESEVDPLRPPPHVLSPTSINITTSCGYGMLYPSLSFCREKHLATAHAVEQRYWSSHDTCATSVPAVISTALSSTGELAVDPLCFGGDIPKQRHQSADEVISAKLSASSSYVAFTLLRVVYDRL
jgi:hypothetical protein